MWIRTIVFGLSIPAFALTILGASGVASSSPREQRDGGYSATKDGGMRSASDDGGGRVTTRDSSVKAADDSGTNAGRDH